MQISWAARTDRGLRRSHNEDKYCARPDLGLFVVADGMGGHAGGEIAAALAADQIRQAIETTAGLSRDDSWPIPFDAGSGVDGNRLRVGLTKANIRIAQEIKEFEKLRGMGTTVVAILVTGCKVALAHIGDSRAYLHRGASLRRLTKDHSWVEEQMRAGTLTEAAARHHPWRNIVTRALSGCDELLIDVTELEFEAGDRLLLCSDGLTAVLEDSEIQRVVAAPADLEGVCDELVGRANAAGGPDNITTVMVAVAAN